MEPPAEQKEEYKEVEDVEEKEGTDEEDAESSDGDVEEDDVDEADETEASKLCEDANALLEKEDLDASDLAQAVAWFTQALELDAQSIVAMLGLAYAYGLAGRFAEGSELLTRAKASVSADSEFQADIAEMMQELQEMSVAAEEEGGSEEEEEEEGEEEGSKEGAGKEEVKKEESKKDETPTGTAASSSTDTQATSAKHEAANTPQDTPLVALIEDGTMTQAFYEALCTVFAHYDRDSDGAWSPRELDDFHVCVNAGEHVSKETTAFLQANFPCTRRGWLTRDGFLGFYLTQTAGDPQETWKDLRTLGFDSSLKPIDKRYAHVVRVQAGGSSNSGGGKSGAKRKGKK